MRPTTNAPTLFNTLFHWSASLALALLLPACGGGGGGGGSQLGAFASSGEVLSIDSDTLAARVAAEGATGNREVHALARDSSRDLFYAFDSASGELLRIDDAGRVTSVGLPSEPVTTLAYDPDADELVGVQSGGRLRPSKLLRIDPDTAEATVVAETSPVADVAYDRALRRLLGVFIGSTGVRTNTLIAIDVDTGSTTTLFDDPGFGQSRGLAFDPLTRTLLTGIAGDPGAVQEYSLSPAGILAVTQYERLFEDLTFDTDTGRLFGLSEGGELFECTNPGGGTLGGVATPLVTLSRELYGFTFDPADGRFFAVDAANHELVKFDPSRNRTTRVARIGLRARLHRDVRTLAYDPVLGHLYGMDRRYQELLSIDPLTGEAQPIRVGLGSEAILSMDQAAGRLFAYDQAAEVLLEVFPDAETSRILDNAIGLTKVEDMEWDPTTGRLVALHESAGRTGEPQLSSIALSGTAGPLPHTDVPAGLTALGRDSRTGLFHAVGAGQPRVEMELDLASGSSFFQTIRTVDGAWATSFRAALRVPSLGVVLAVDRERLYSWDPGTRRMTLEGSLPAGVQPSDLVFDPAAGHLGLREGDTITWVSPSVPFRPLGMGDAPVQTDLRLTCDGSGRAYGVLDGILYEVRYGSVVSLRTLTPLARANFDVESVAHSSSAGAVFATGTDTLSREQVLVRFDVATGEWTDLGAVPSSVSATFSN